jgi:hypothetical protein
MTNWYPFKTSTPVETHSPIKLGSAKPYWVLAADANVKINNKWGAKGLAAGDTRSWVYANIPPHAKNGEPAGGNEVFADGSATWCKFETMHRFQTWDNSKYVYWYQDPSDFGATLRALLNSGVLK